MRRDPACPICGDHPTIKELIDYETFCGIVPEPENTGNPDEVTVQDMKNALDNPALGIKVSLGEGFSWSRAGATASTEQFTYGRMRAGQVGRQLTRVREQDIARRP